MWTRNRLRAWGAAATLGLTLLAARPAAGQERDFSFGPTTTPGAMLADQLATRARTALAGAAQPRPDQMLRARALMDFALLLAPDDADLWRLSMELHRRAGDTAAEFDALRRYVRLRPADDAAQLRMILAGVDAKQTIEQRIAVLERVLDGPGADSLSAALRSRVASTVADWARESGDTQRFSARLKQAVQLDPTNAQAARLLYDFAVARGATPLELGVAAMAMVRANPMDPDARRALANILLSQAAYTPAAEQFKAAQLVSARPLGQTELSTIVPAWVVSLAAGVSPGEALGMLEQVDRAYAQARVAASQPADAAKLPPFPLDLELLRLAILDQAGRGGEADAAFTRIRARLGEKPADANAAADLAWIAAVFNRADEEIIKAFDEAVKEDTPAVRRTRGWLAVNRRQADEARSLLRPLASSDAFAALGLARVEPDPAAQRQLLRQAVALDPAGLAGMLAARELGSTGVTDLASPQGSTLVDRVNAWPAGIRSPDAAQEPWVLMRIALDPIEYGYLEPVAARVTLRNTTDQALSLGNGGTLPTTLFINVTLRRGGAVMPDTGPVVADLGRRLRLEPRETLEVPVRLDRGGMGYVLSMTPAETLSFSTTAILDPRATQRGMAPGPLGATDTSALARRNGMPVTPANLDYLLRSVAEGGQSQARFRALAFLANVVPQMQADNDETRAGIQRIAEVVAAAYGKLDAPGQAWTLLFIPPTPQGRERFAPVLAAAERSDTPLVRVAHLVAHVTDPESPAMNAALRHPDKRIADFAQAHRVALIEAAKAAAAREAAKAEDEATK